MIKYKIIWNGEQLETRFNTRSEAERFASERYNIEKDEVNNGRANDKNGTFWEDYPEYEIEAYETSVVEEWIRDFRYSMDPYSVNPYDNIYPPFKNINHPPCPHCSTSMNFFNRNSDDAYRECPDCDFSITDKEIFNFKLF